MFGASGFGDHDIAARIPPVLETNTVEVRIWLDMGTAMRTLRINACYDLKYNQWCNTVTQRIINTMTKPFVGFEYCSNIVSSGTMAEKFLY